MKLRFHLIPNAHLDPVWLWDGREGLNEGITTCKTILDLMDEDPELTFIRGESVIYRHIERHDPETFARIKAMVDAGRWDIVGGSYLQPDTNLPAAETFIRHYLTGTAYFRETFGKTPRVGWAADSFGHSGGLPDILSHCGIEGYAFTRPFAGESSAFWWEGVGGGRVLAYRPPVGWYGAERDEMPRRLDALLDAARKTEFVNVGVFFGIGNHGGGPTRRQLRDIRAWAAAHESDIELVPSGLHRLFADLRAEIAGRELPVHKGELNFCLRGCYASVAKFKFLYRKAEALLARTETLGAGIALATDGAAPDLDATWETLLFNSFHDILPGTSIERAFDDQIAQLGGVIHGAQTAELASLNVLARAADTSVPKPDGDEPSAVPFLVVNPSETAFDGLVALEAGLDYRPLWDYRGRPDEVPAVVRAPDGTVVPHQKLAVENLFGAATMPWRERALVPVSLPPFGWAVYTLGLEDGAPLPTPGGDAGVDDGAVLGGGWRVAVDGDRVLLERNGVRCPLTAVTVEDPYGSWGEMGEAPESLELSTVRHHWSVEKTQVLEKGPLRSALWVRLVGGNSWLELTLRLESGQDRVSVDARVLWNERSARLKLCLPTGAAAAEFSVPGGVVTRAAGTGEVPGGRWVTAGDVTVATDSLYNFDLTADGTLRATVCRATRYAADSAAAPDDAPWQPAVDAGELRFKMALSIGDGDPDRLADSLERAPVAQTVRPGNGALGRTGTLLAVAPEFRLLALKPAERGEGWVIRARNQTTATASLWAEVLGERSASVDVAAGATVTARLQRGFVGWSLTPTDGRETVAP